LSVFRTRDIFLILVMMAAAALTYKIKHDSQRYYAELRHLERQIEAEKKTFTLLKADWAVVSDPARLQRLALRYHEALGLEILTPQQFVHVREVPEKLPDAIDMLIAENDDLGVELEHFDTIDTILTGSLQP